MTACPSEERIELLAHAVERRERELDGAADRRERAAGWWADRPADLHQKLVFEHLDHRVAVAESALVAARVELAEVAR